MEKQASMRLVEITFCRNGVPTPSRFATKASSSPASRLRVEVRAETPLFTADFS